MKKIKSTALGFTTVGALALLAAALGVARASQAQVMSTPCSEGGFDICFPNLDSGAPNACGVASSGAVEAEEPGAASDAGAAAQDADVAAQDAVTVTACLSQVCGDEASEPHAGFFEYCCARGGSEKYDDFCVWWVQDECGAVAELCAERCAPLELLLSTTTLAPPTAACLDGYPPFIASVCAMDPFCCETAWDGLCAEEAVLMSPS